MFHSSFDCFFGLTRHFFLLAASAAAHEAAHMDVNASTVTAPPRPIAAARPRRTSGSDARDLERLFTDSRALFFSTNTKNSLPSLSLLVCLLVVVEKKHFVQW